MKIEEKPHDFLQGCIQLQQGEKIGIGKLSCILKYWLVKHVNELIKLKYWENVEKKSKGNGLGCFGLSIRINRKDFECNIVLD